MKLRQSVQLNTVRVLSFSLLLTVVSCLGLNGGGDAQQRPDWLAGLLALVGGGVDLPDPVVASSPPTITQSAMLEPGVIQVAESSIDEPSHIRNSYVPVGKVYEIGFELPQAALDAIGFAPNHIELPESVTLSYQYDAVELANAGFVEEFQVFYLDSASGDWFPLPGVRVDRENHKVTAPTTHFTPFVLTALPRSTLGQTTLAPACLRNAATGIGALSGNGGAEAELSTIGEHYRFFRDRDWRILPGPGFTELGLQYAAGVATCNGGVAPCDQPDPLTSIAYYRESADPGYLTFAAHRDLDIYLMYNSPVAGGANDPDWLRLDPQWTNTGHTIDTDFGGSYTAYVRRYSQGETIVLPGGYAQLPDPLITPANNYWLAIKLPQYPSPAAHAAGALCTPPDIAGPQNVNSVNWTAGVDRIILGWQNPPNADFSAVIVRQTLAPAVALTIEQGSPPSGRDDISPAAYIATGLAPGVAYNFTLFTLDNNGNVSSGVVVNAATSSGPDSDGDGLSDAFESGGDVYPNSPAVETSNPASANTDGDTYDDDVEIALGTNPVDPDSVPPILTFTRLTEATTQYPLVYHEMTATDGSPITGWMVVRGDGRRPPSWDNRWSPTPPSTSRLPGSGNHRLYGWVRDAAGNVSPQRSFTVHLDCCVEPRFLYATGYATGISYLSVFRVDADDYGRLHLQGTVAGRRVVTVHPSGSIAFVADGDSVESYTIDPVTGALGTLIDSESTPATQARVARIAPNGRWMVLESGYTQFRVYRIESDGSLTATGNFTLDQDVYEGRLWINASSDRLYIIYGYDYLKIYSVHPETAAVTATDWGGNWDTWNVSHNSWPIPAGGMTISMLFPPHWNRVITSIDGCTTVTSPMQSSPGLQYVAAVGRTSWNCSLNFVNAIHAHPIRNFFYALSGDSDTLTAYAYDPGTDAVTVAGAIPLADNRNLNDFGANYAVVVDPQGRNGYLPARDSPDPGRNGIRGIAFDPVTGLPQDRGILHAGAYTNIALASSYSRNNPPIANAGEDRRIALDGRAGDLCTCSGIFCTNQVCTPSVNFRRVILNGGQSIDPDGSACQASPLTASWQLVSAPAGSALTPGPGAITNNTALSGASFVYDARGVYEFELRVTDNAGTCAGAGLSATDRLIVHVGTLRQQQNYVIAGRDIYATRPNPQAKLLRASTSAQRYGFLQRNVALLGITRHHGKPFVGLIPAAACDTRAGRESTIQLEWLGTSTQSSARAICRDQFVAAGRPDLSGSLPPPSFTAFYIAAESFGHPAADCLFGAYCERKYAPVIEVVWEWIE